MPQVPYHIYASQQPSSKYTLNVYVHLEEEEKEEEDFQTVPLDDVHWDMEEILNRPIMYPWIFHYCMVYVHIHVHIQITTPHHTMMHWI